MNGGREHHGMYIHMDKLYIVGGATPGSMVGDPSIEIWDTDKGTSQRVECLRYSCMRYGIFISNVECCSIPGHDDSLVIYGPLESNNVPRHTIQIYCINNQVVTHSITIPQDSISSVCSVLPVAGSRLLLIAEDYTAICRYEDIISNNPQNIRFCHNFEVPNIGCAVCLTDDRQHVMLYGGEPEYGSPDHCVYTASVADIMNDHSCGWSKVDTPWPLGKCRINAYDTMEIGL